MNKRSKLIVSIISLVLIVLFVLYYFFNKQIKTFVAPETKTGNKIATTSATTSATTTDMMTKEEQEKLGLFHRAVYEVTRDETGKITHAQIIGIKKPEPIAFDTMTAEERTTRGLASSTKVQVLLRDSSGKIKAYRVMKNDNDIATKY